MAYETLALVDAVVLAAKGKRLSRIRPNGGDLLCFEFDDLDEQHASALLNSADATFARTFHHVLRDVRRQMDAVKLQGGNGGGGRPRR
jgi:hypothetical protein